MIKNIIKHFILITKHRLIVLKLCAKIGLIWRGLVHDLSKYSPTEFWESVKYYDGNKSPIVNCKKDKGYSEAWLHHKGRNKHHAEYWVDMKDGKIMYIVIPYKYVAELVCDQQAAGMAYKGKEWKQDYELKYWKRGKDNFQADERIKNFIEKVHSEVAKNGINKTFTKSNMKKWYKEYVEDKL